MKPLRVFLLLICSSTIASAGNPEFHGVVRALEGTYGVHHLRIPLLGLALFFARPEGVSGVKLAVIEGFQAPADLSEISHLLERSLGPDWHPFVRVRSHDPGETTLIYANPGAKKMRMMIVSIESSEATIVECSIGDRAIKGWLKEPEERAEDQSGHRHHFE